MKKPPTHEVKWFPGSYQGGEAEWKLCRLLTHDIALVPDDHLRYRQDTGAIRGGSGGMRPTASVDPDSLRPLVAGERSQQEIAKIGELTLRHRNISRFIAQREANLADLKAQLHAVEAELAALNPKENP